MKKLDQFLLKSFLGPFIMIFLIVVFVLVMQFLWLYIDELVGKGLSIWVILEFMFWGACTILPLAMPLATLITSIMTLGNMGENYELTAMKAAGISLQRILAPLIVASMGISIAAFFVSNDLIPEAYNKIYTLQYDINKTKEEIKIPTGTFYNGIDGYVLRIEDRNKETDMMYGVMVYNHTKNRGNISVAVADSGSLKATPDKKALLFTLYSGISYEEDNKREYRDTTFILNKVEFDMQELIIPLENYSFQKSDEDRYGNEIMAQDLKNLKQDRDSIGEIYNNIYERQKTRFLYSSNLTYSKQLDTALNKGYKHVAERDSMFIWKGNKEELMSVSEAIVEVNNTIGTLESYDRESASFTYSLRRIDLESFRKFTLSFACLVFFFIGAPLGAIIRKGGLGTPVLVSALFFVLYWVVDISGKKLARDGSMSPFVGAFISTLVLLPLGIFITWKATNESSIFNIDTYIKPIKLFFKKVGEIPKVLIKGSKGRRIVFMGTPEFAVASLKALVEGGYNVVGVVTVPDKPSGRGQKLSMSAVKQYAIENHLQVLQPESLKDQNFLEALGALRADCFVVVAFRMLPQVVWSMPRFGTFNLHASLLPQYRGAAPINWAIINGEKETGVTTFLLDSKIDTGKILFSEKCQILPEDNIGTLYDKLMAMGSALVLKSVDALFKKSVAPKEQSEEGIVLRPAPKITRETCRIDFSRSAEEVHNLIRGLSPYPAACSVMKISEKRTDVKIYTTRLFSNPLNEDIPIGGVETDGKSYLAVKCADGMIAIEELQVSGKRRLKIKEFLAGVHNLDISFE